MRRRLFRLLNLLIGPALLALLLYNVGWAESWATLRQAMPSYLLLALLGYLLSIGVRGYRWQLLLAAQEVHAPLPRLIYLDFVGSFFNTLLPTNLSGDLIKFHHLSQAHAEGEHLRSRIASSLLADRFCGLWVLLLMGGLLAPVAGHLVPLAFTLPVSGAALLGGLLLLLLLHPQIRSRVERTVPGLTRLLERARLRGLYQSLAQYGPRTLLRVLAVSLLFNLLVVGINVLLGLAFGVNIALLYYFLLVPLIALLVSLPISINGVGIREGGYIAFFAQAGVAHPPALAMGLAYYSCTVVAGLLGGFLYATSKMRRGSEG